MKSRDGTAFIVVATPVPHTHETTPYRGPGGKLYCAACEVWYVPEKQARPSDECKHTIGYCEHCLPSHESDAY